MTRATVHTMGHAAPREMCQLIAAAAVTGSDGIDCRRNRVEAGVSPAAHDATAYILGADARSAGQDMTTCFGPAWCTAVLRDAGGGERKKLQAGAAATSSGTHDVEQKYAHSAAVEAVAGTVAGGHWLRARAVEAHGRPIWSQAPARNRMQVLQGWAWSTRATRGVWQRRC